MLRELIEKYYQDKKEEKQRVKFYISEAGKCPRQIFFKFKSAPKEELDPRFLRIFEQGDVIHEKLVRMLRSMGILECAEIPIAPQEDISGRADAVVVLNRERYLIDFKSINSSILRGMKEPKEEHVSQVQLYLHFFNIKRGILLYEGKDTLELKEFTINYDNNLAKRILKQFKDLKDNLQKDIVPECLSDYPKNWQCRYCQFKDVCETAGTDKIDWKEIKEKNKG